MYKNKIIIILTLLCLSPFLWAQTNIDSLESLLIHKEGKEKIDLLNTLSYSLWNISPEKGIEYGKLSSQLLEEYNYPKGKANNLITTGICYWAKGDYNIASDYYFKALKLGEELKDTNTIAKSLNNLGIVYDYMGNYDKALEYYKRGLKYFQKLEDKYSLASVYGNIGALYEISNELDSTLFYYEESVKIFKEIDSKYGIAGGTHNLGNLFFKLGENVKALDHYLIASKIYKDIGDTYGTVVNTINIGKTYVLLEEYQKAWIYLHDGLSVAKKAGMKEHVMESYSMLSWLFENKKDYEKSIKYLKLSYETKDSIYNAERSNQIAGMRIKYESVKKENENEILRITNENQQLQIDKQTNLRKLWFTISVIFILLLIFYYSQLRLKKRANSSLLQKNEIINEQKDQLVNTLTKLEKVVAEKEKFFSIIAHDLRSPFNIILGYVELLDKDFDDYDEVEQKEFIHEIARSSKSTFALLENLLNWSMFQQGKIHIKMEKLNLAELINASIEPYSSGARKKNIQIINMITDGIIIDADKYTMSTSIGNLINNAIKFTSPKGKIIISAIKNIKNIDIYIKDNGVGMSPEQITKLFKIEKTYSSLGTSGEKGTGLGLILCKEFIEKNSGHIQVESEIGLGSKFIISLPISNNKEASNS